MGDICYIKVETHEQNTFYITASTEGYYVNKVRMTVIIDTFFMCLRGGGFLCSVKFLTN